MGCFEPCPFSRIVNAVIGEVAVVQAASGEPDRPLVAATGVDGTGKALLH